MSYYFQAFKKYIDFSGRATRPEYWYFILFTFIVSVIIGMLGIFGLSARLVISLSVLYALLSIVPAIAVTVRRLHDINYSGWWFLLLLIPFVNIIVFVLTLLKSDPNNNKYNK